LQKPESRLLRWRLQLSLRFGPEGNTRRVTALFWGNGGRQLRLDVMAGVGAVLGKVLEDGEHFLIYSPRENRAYFYQGAASPLLRLGVPFPFGLSQLAALLNGHYTGAFGSGYATAEAVPDGQWAYRLGAKPGGHLILNAQGQPVLWLEDASSGAGWRMEVIYDDAAPALPRRLNLRHSNGNGGVLLVKERENGLPPFNAVQLELVLPDDAPLLPLAQFKAR
ncbi:MAG: hypothetical protein Q4F27_02870, partial [Desulfovibrionaceae bacterium]|nr:hypothetical protein [Desulfovibrionaceae bacterium]